MAIYKKIFESISDAVLIADSKGIVLDANPQAEKVLGSLGRLKGQQVNHIVEESPFSWKTIKSDTGEQFFISQEKVNESELKYLSLTEVLPQLMWTSTPDGKVNFANQRCLIYTGMSTQEKYGEGWVSSIHPEDLPRVGAAWMKSMQTGEIFGEEYRIKDGKGNYQWFLGRAVPVKSKEGEIQYWIGIATDIEIHRQTILNLEAERNLREQFVSLLSHDLKSPLTAAKTSAELLLRYNHDTEQLPTFVTRIINSVHRADKMINNLLDANLIKAGKILPLRKEKCDLVMVMHETLEELRSIHGDRFILDGEPSITGNWSRDGLRRIIDNLCSNAIKYGDPHESIKVSIFHEGKNARFSVNNKGNSLSDSEISEIFEPFRRTNSALSKGAHGWGLGLTLVKGLIDAHEGKVEVSSNSEEGTSFTVILPT